MPGPGQPQGGPGMPDPINALQNLASQGSRNPMMNMGPQPGQMGGPQQGTATNLLQTLNRGPTQQMMMGNMPGNMPGNMGGNLPMQVGINIMDFHTFTFAGLLDKFLFFRKFPLYHNQMHFCHCPVIIRNHI